MTSRAQTKNGPPVQLEEGCTSDVHLQHSLPVLVFYPIPKLAGLDIALEMILHLL